MDQKQIGIFIAELRKEQGMTQAELGEKSIIDFLCGTGTGLLLSALYSPDTVRRTVIIADGLVMIGIGWYRKAGYDKIKQIRIYPKN